MPVEKRRVRRPSPPEPPGQRRPAIGAPKGRPSFAIKTVVRICLPPDRRPLMAAQSLAARFLVAAFGPARARRDLGRGLVPQRGRRASPGADIGSLPARVESREIP